MSITYTFMSWVDVSLPGPLANLDSRFFEDFQLSCLAGRPSVSGGGLLHSVYSTMVIARSLLSDRVDPVDGHRSGEPELGHAYVGWKLETVSNN